MTASRRELWLADSFVALDDVEGEISHLRSAVKSEPNDLKLRERLANRLIDIQDIDEAKKAIKEIERIAPADPEVKILKDRIRSFQEK